MQRNPRLHWPHFANPRHFCPNRLIIDSQSVYPFRQSGNSSIGDTPHCYYLGWNIIKQKRDAKMSVSLLGESRPNGHQIDHRILGDNFSVDLARFAIPQLE